MTESPALADAPREAKRRSERDAAIAAIAEQTAALLLPYFQYLIEKMAEHDETLSSVGRRAFDLEGFVIDQQRRLIRVEIEIERIDNSLRRMSAPRAPL